MNAGEGQGFFKMGAIILDGPYDWIAQIIAIAVFVLAFNFLIKWSLERLQHRFKRNERIWQYSFIKAVYRPLSYLVWFGAALIAADILASHFFEKPLLTNPLQILGAGAVLAVSWFLMRWKKHIVHHLVIRSKRSEIAIDQGKIDAIDKIITIAIVFFAILLMLEVTNRSMATLIAFGGVGGIALAFASQEIIANFFGGLMIYLTQPFSVGDWIVLPGHSIEGHVEEIGWYTTKVRSIDKRPVYVPNSIFSKLVVINPSRMSHRQIKEKLEIRIEDAPKLKEIISDLKTMLENHPEIDHAQPIIACLEGFGQHSFDVLVSALTQTTDGNRFLKIREEILFAVLEVLAEHEAQLAMPAQQITLTESSALKINQDLIK